MGHRKVTRNAGHSSTTSRWSALRIVESMRLPWVLHLLLIVGFSPTRDTIANASIAHQGREHCLQQCALQQCDTTCSSAGNNINNMFESQ
eukprot:3860663-Amphidinium_carterae.1